MSGMLAPLPLSLQIPSQIIALRLSTHVSSLCSTKLLVSTLYTERIYKMAYALQAIPHALTGGGFVIPQDPIERCTAVLTFIQVLLIFVLPVLSSLYFAPPVVMYSARHSALDQQLISAVSCLISINPKLQQAITPPGSHQAVAANVGTSKSRIMARVLYKFFVLVALVSTVWFYCCSTVTASGYIL